jgi:uncharacterized protein YfbU (UPF0304 family)
MTDQVGLKGNRDGGTFDEYPEELKEDHLRLCKWLNELAQKYKEKVRIEIIDPQSFRGFYKSIRYRTQTYPTFIVNKREEYTDADKSQLDLILQSYLARS